MGKKIKMRLSTSSIRNAIEELEVYRDSIEEKTYLLGKRLSELGVDIAKTKVVELDAVFTGELRDSISSIEKSCKDGKNVFAIKANSKHAIFVEVGTGIIGASSPYPGKLPVTYAQGKSFTTLEKPFGKYPAGTYGWFYERDGKVYFTEGMPSRPFMYETGMEIGELVVNEAKKIFQSE